MEPNNSSGKKVTVDSLFKTLGGMFLAICAFFLKEAWTDIRDHGRRIVKLEVSSDNKTEQIKVLGESIRELQTDLNISMRNISEQLATLNTKGK